MGEQPVQLAVLVYLCTMHLRSALIVLASLLLAACTHEVAAPPESPRQTDDLETEDFEQPVDVQANELGEIPVLMYHRVIPEPESVYDRTPAGFRAELERLAREDYIPITTAELVAGDIDLPAGKHPVVLTFDDGDPSVLTMNNDDSPAEGTAIHTLLDVAEEYPDFRPVASVYVNADPFRGGAAGRRALTWLHENGFEIGNHTFGHTNLGAASADEVQSAISQGDEAIRAAVPGYRPRTMALPFGVRPDPAGLAVEGDEYHYSAALLVGANPAPSPYGAGFDPHAVPRIRSQGPDGAEADYGSTAWLDKLAADPDRRYTSDGDPTRIRYPEESGEPAARFAGTAVAY